VLESLGEDYLALKRYPEAFDSFRQQQKLAEENGDRRAELRALGHLGITHLRVRKYQLSLQCQWKSLAIAENLQDREGQANALFNAALALQALKERTSAIDQAREALSIYTDIESPLTNRVQLTLEKWVPKSNQPCRDKILIRPQTAHFDFKSTATSF
jgi:tetratricopeptide (TPR) repeat protein